MFAKLTVRVIVPSFLKELTYHCRHLISEILQEFRVGKTSRVTQNVLGTVMTNMPKSPESANLAMSMKGV